MNQQKLNLLIFSFCFLLYISGFGQNRMITGYIRDRQSDEPIPFASVMLKKSRRGVVTDTSGKFALEVPQNYINDSLIINDVGYKSVSIWAGNIMAGMVLEFKLEVLPPKNEVFVKAKYNRALWFWKRIMKYKPLHEKSRWDNYSYEIYNKLEVDLENINTKKLNKNVLLKPLNFVFNYSFKLVEIKVSHIEFLNNSFSC